MISSTLEILERLVGFDTTSRNSNLDLIDWVEDFARQAGARTTRTYDKTGTKANLLISAGPVDTAGIILSGHTDVVSVDGQSWAGDPFSLRRDGDRVLGRGVTDMKGFVACCLAGLPQMTGNPLSNQIHIALSYDEEVGCLGVPDLIDGLIDLGPRPAMCFVGEPTEMSVVIAHKTKRSLRAIIKGLSCHSSRAPEGVNAVEYASRLITRITELRYELEHGPADPMYDIPFSTAHTGICTGGTALNIVPDSCIVDFEFRVLPDQDADLLVRRIRHFAETVLLPDMRDIASSADIEIELTSAYPGLDTPADAPVVQMAQRLSGKNSVQKVAYGTEAGLFQTRGLIPSVVVGPGSIAQAHIADEFIDVAQLALCDLFVGNLIDECMSGRVLSQAYR